jgi:hypothetical protein
MAEWADHIEDRVSCFEAVEEGCGFANGLHDDGDGAGGRIGAFDGERDALAILTDAQNDELSGPLFARNARRLNFELAHIEADGA